jgi:hypothetical protein
MRNEPPKEDRLISLYRRAFSHAGNDDDAVFGLARRYAEAYCHEVLALYGHPPPAGRTLEDLLKQLATRQIGPAEATAHLRTIQIYGNAGSHHDPSAGPMDMKPCLEALTSLHGLLLARRKETKLDAQLADAAEKNEFRLASSGLTVVRAIELGWDLEGEFGRHGLALQRSVYPWSDRILDDLSDGTVDIAIYNAVRAREFAARQNAMIHILGAFGRSMGGRNFYLLGRTDGRWGRLPREGLSGRLENVTIAVPYGSDIDENVKLALEANDRELAERGIRLLNMPANAGLEIFNLDANILVSGGQNLRLLARHVPGYSEVVSFEWLPAAVQDVLFERAENCIVVSTSALERITEVGLANLHSRLRQNFQANWHHASRGPTLLRELSSSIQLDGIRSQDAELITSQILYETYRIEQP